LHFALFSRRLENISPDDRLSQLGISVYQTGRKTVFPKLFKMLMGFCHAWAEVMARPNHHFGNSDLLVSLPHKETGASGHH